MASDLAIVSGLTGRQTSWPAAKAVATGEQPCAWAPFIVGIVAGDQPGVDELLEAAGDLRELRAGGDRADDAVRQLPAELLDRLERERLGALGVVRAQVDVHERPARPLARDLGAEPVDVVVVAAGWPRSARRRRPWPGSSAPRGRTGSARRRAAPRPRRARRRRWRGCPWRHRRACRSRAPCTRQGDGDDAVLERVRRVRGLVLDLQLTDPEPLGEAVGLDQRRPARRQRRARGARQRQEVGVAPDRVRAGLDAGA